MPTFTSIEQYIQSQNSEQQRFLNQLNQLITDTLPLAQPKIAWHMPSYQYHQFILHFKAYQEHVKLYLGKAAVKHFQTIYPHLTYTNSAIKLFYQQELPIAAITAIILWNFQQVKLKLLKLVKPSQTFETQLLDIQKAFRMTDSEMDGSGGLLRFKTIQEWLAFTKCCEKAETCPPPLVSASQYLCINELEELVGMIQVRHTLNEWLLNYGGHIGYCIHPKYRQQGYGKQMLALCLKKCHALNLKKVLITCATDNIGSRNIILANNGKFESTAYLAEANETIERYWIRL